MHARWVLVLSLIVPGWLLGLAGCGDNAARLCDDRVFCNGVERLVGGDCVAVAANPCDDFSDCTMDLCNESSQTCDHIPMGASCATCKQEACTPACDGRACGDDGCG